MTLEESVPWPDRQGRQQSRLRVIVRAQQMGNVSKACREFGIPRSLFYRWRKRYLAYGPDGLRPGHAGARRGRPPTLSMQAERAVLALALVWPTWGPLRLSQQLALPEHGGWELAASTIYRLLKRTGLQTRWERLAVLELHSAQAAGLLTERTRRQLLAAQRRAGKHVQAEKPGELVCLDTFFIGKLKGVGKVWQITACDAASSFAMAEITLNFTTRATAQFLARRVVPALRKAGWPVQRVLTDQGNEFRGAFDHACAQLGIRHTRTQPRHAWTNGFVERLQGTILNEHWRLEFRRRYFTGISAMQVSLDRYLDFYNWRRPHQGYRTKGRTPGQVVAPRRARHANAS
ncbi:MAG TPA: IS481 family transposase [Anaerolineales bacterium]|nr:IS481 family transposase [Anaerolineales bacterium]